MRITFVTPPPNLSGGLRVVATLADRLHARGHVVTVVAEGPRPLRRRERWRRLLRPGRSGGAARETHFDRMQASLRLLAHPGPVTDADLPDADVVIATWWETAFAVAALSPAKGRKVYFVQHHEVHDHLPRHLSAGSYYLPLRKITISGWLRDTMRDLYGDNDVALVPNAVDTALFRAGQRRRQPRPTVGLMHAAARFKGVDVALAALERVRRNHPDLRILAFGTQSPRPPLTLPAGAAFHLRPPQAQLAELYAACDVFLTASRSEGFGLPILEAMACGTPVVATRTGCASDVIAAGVTGHVAEVDDAEGLARGICDVLALPDAAWVAMSRAALRRAHSYSWDDAATLFEAAVQPRPQGSDPA